MKKGYVKVSGFIIGYTWYGERGVLQISPTDMPKKKAYNLTVNDLKHFDTFGCESVIGAELTIREYKIINGELYLSVYVIDSIQVGQVTQKDLEWIDSMP